jgi:uncharacterized membrane protein YbhN (UPF0104 family)
MGAFFHAVRVFGEHLAAVRWEFLGLALALHVVKLVLRSIAWRTILDASYPDECPRMRSALGAYIAGVGVNSIAPARAGDLVKLFLIRHRIPESSYATLTPTLVAETLFDFVVGAALIVWALTLHVLPTHQLYARLPSVEWGFFLRHEYGTAIGLLVAALAGAVGFWLFVRHGSEFRARLAQGFAILRDPRRFLSGVILPQAASWLLRIASVYYFLRAFRVNATIHNALLAQVVDSLSTLFPATPGGAGTKQGLIVFLFHGQAVSKAALLAFSVGMYIAILVCNLLLGAIALGLMAKTLRWRKLSDGARGTPQQPA